MRHPLPVIESRQELYGGLSSESGTYLKNPRKNTVGGQMSVINKRYRMLLRFQARLPDWTGTNWAYNPVTGSLDHTAGVGDTVVSPNVDSALAEIHPGIYYVEYAVSNWTTGPFNLKLWGVVSDSGDQTGNGARTAIFTIVTPLSRVMEFDPAVTFDGSLDYFKAWRSG